MREFSQEQAIEIRKNIMQEFHSFCERNGLRYSLAYGSLLGAVRHGGMIPWDDDIDLVMPREDYERLCQMYPSGDCTDRYQFVNNRNHPEINTKIGYFIDFSTITETAGVAKDYHGIHVDVYPLDVVPNGTFERKWLFFRRKIAHLLIRLKDLHPDIMSGPQKWIRQLVVFLLTPVRSESLYSWLHKMSGAWVDMPESDRKNVSCLVESGTPRIFPYASTKTYASYAYDGYEFQGFADYDAPLQSWYGDYMTLPPEDQRKRPSHKWLHYYYKDDSE